MNKNAYLITRLAIGATMFGHGLVRLPKFNAFVQGTVESFQNSMLPTAMVAPFAYLIVIAEFVIGLLLLIGLFTRQAAFAGGILMVTLITGACLIENWGVIATQLLHAAFFIVVLQFADSNSYAVDRLRTTN